MGCYDTAFKLSQREGAASAIEADVLFVPVYLDNTEAPTSDDSDDKADAPKANYKKYDCLDELNTAMGGAIYETLDSDCFSAKIGSQKCFKTRSTDSVKARWVVVYGASNPAKPHVNVPRLDRLIDALKKGIKSTFSGQDVKHVAFCLCLPEGASVFCNKAWVYAITQAGLLSTYKTRQVESSKLHKLETVSIHTDAAVEQQVLDNAVAVAKATSLTLDLANEPANLKSTQALVDVAKSVEGKPGVSVEVISDKKVLRETMPAFWAVGQASAETDDPPQYMRVHYRHPEAAANCPKVALVGKGVIFDTGGVQVKPGEYMNDMKFDMSGAATVLSVIKSAIELGLKNIDVTAYVAAARNLTGETAYLPDSVIDSASGKKLEIRHTDAEGRVTLADSVHKATLDKPDEMITIATLTGAAVAAVGNCTALMGTCEKHKATVEAAFKAVGDQVQSLEFIEEDYENVKSKLDCADVRNTSKGKGRGHLTAGAFVVGFAGDIPTVHLDIAGGDAKDGFASGIAVRGLMQYLFTKAGQ